jgi:hypothetical protein
MTKILAALMLAAAVIPAAHAQPARPMLCPDATEALQRDPAMQAAVNVALKGFGKASEGECLYPHTLLKFAAADVLIVNKTRVGGTGHSESASLSAYVLRSDRGAPRLVTVYRDFADIGTMGEPGEIKAAKVAGDDAILALPGGIFQGYSFTDLTLFVFRGGKLISLSAVRVNASSVGAKEDEKDAVQVDGAYQLDTPAPGKLTVDFAINNKGAKRSERVVYRLEGDKWVVESGKVPEPEIEEGSGG